MFPFFKTCSSKEKVFIFFIMMANFLISCEYGITRPACNSIYISTYTASWIPYAWIASIPLNFFLISLYNRLLPRLGCQKMFISVQSAVVLVNLVAGIAATSIPFFPFFQAIWKDFYILLMFKQVWSLIHTTISSKQAKFIYGAIAGMGGLGSVVGGFLAQMLAVPLGSQALFFFTLPLYCLLFVCYTFALRSSQMGGVSEVSQNETLFPNKSGISLIRNSRSLIFILFIVVFMQFSISLIDFQFNLALEKAFSLTDLRTQYYGKIIWITNSLTALFQFCGGLILIHFLGVKKSHLLIPILLLCNGVLLFFVPAFAVVSYAFVSIKTLDYSLFGIVREMLYIPLKVNEKFQAKAIIDVFAYRAARAVGSFLILFLQFWSSHLSILLRISSILIFFCWFFLVLKLFRPQEAPGNTLPVSEG